MPTAAAITYTSASLFTDSSAELFDVQEFDTFTTSDYFSTVLMWQPSGANSIWVPVSSTNWTWAATVSFNYNNNTWGLSSPSYPAAQVLYGGYWPVYHSTFITKSTPLTCN